MEDKDLSICNSDNVPSHTASSKQPKKTKQLHMLIDDDDADDEEIMQSCHIYSSQINKFRNMKRKVVEKVLLMDPDVISDEEISEPKNKITRKKRDRKTQVCVNLDDSSEDLPHSEVSQEKIEEELRSPSPPPPVHLTGYKTRKVSSKSNKLFKELQEAELVYKATCLIYNDDELSNSFQENAVKVDNCDREIQVKIRWRGSIHRISMKRGQKFGTVMSQLSDIVGACIEEIVLYFDEKTVQTEDTPDSLGLTVADILDCFIIKTKKMETERIAESSQANKITIKVQSQNTRQKLNFTVNKFSPLSSLMEDYAKQTNNLKKKLTFKFDGEIISHTDTPADLDMDDGDCLDVKVTE
ncbi:NFATC2-interacting protein-like [Limulus polyphemus]|uniref:NFATC2-interacting protein-like n=1 Tax=Limulus polyphemus TaxID=6850 RepID=A0ABM1B271_LIMPO|nr:NFATC2-interacting protein-like [Limulus polyphemus]XP_013773279.1 NFATC2-interacting protein-like [Limulus polyphemus]XP_013773281.1 NFATC2-interacting protein-like [Limulus polyphemus]XP_013773282.1 NFATC2-interacting protein-like [Limulus polyphemus]XP_013773284.1 NFATC2-interacting protein-like [Limulus polyphemus]XP_022240210.1 NFATC2-interacting protein-like [Limulus polyphemus]